MRRVVVTGVGGLTPLGHDWATVESGLRSLRSGVRRMHEWDELGGINTRLGAPLAALELPARYDRRMTRSMGRVGLLATRSAELALESAGLLGDPLLKAGRVGIAHGASGGSMEPVIAFGRMYLNGDMQGLTSNSYVQMMSHTGAVNIGLAFGITGRIIPTTSACTSGSQGIGYAYESIRWGRQEVMLAGGAEELSAAHAAVFDTLFATSQRNDAPSATPRPFDRDRDGLVVGEGSATLVLEELEHAQRRGARILAEVVGFASNSDGSHITQPQATTMAEVMKMALADADLPAQAIGYISAHGTATERGDIAESQATAAVFGAHTPISSLKSYFGHTLGACGAIEAWLTIEMMAHGWFAPTINLVHPDPRCAELDHIVGAGRDLDVTHVLSSNFAFGGINTALVFRRWDATR